MRIWTFALALGLAVSCTAPAADAPLTFSVQALSLDAKGSEVTFIAHTKSETWTVEPSESWIHVTPTSGSGTVNVKVSASPNPREEERSGSLNFSMPVAFNGIMALPLTQAAGDGSEGPNGPDGPGGEATAVVTTLAASEVTAYSAILNASFSGLSTVNPPQNVIFRWGEAEDHLTQEIAAEESVSSSEGSYFATLSELSGKTQYYFQASLDAWDETAGAYRTVSGKVLSFTTRQNAVYTGTIDWPELPHLDYTHYTEGGNYYTDNNNPALYYTHHWTNEKTAASGSAYQRNYTVCWHSQYKCPVWVAAPRHSWYNGGSGRSSYSHNPDMPREVQYTSTSGSGTYNRGHMLGSAERTRSSAINKQVFYVTNIAPQHATYFNTGGGGWNKLEDWVDKKVCSDTLYIVIGCYFDDFTDGYGNHAEPSKIPSFMGTSNVQCPTMMYYALLRTKNGNSNKAVKDCRADELMCAAFVRAHAAGTKGQEVTAKEMMTITDLEKLTGFTFFANVPNAPKDSITPSDWGLKDNDF